MAFIQQQKKIVTKRAVVNSSSSSDEEDEMYLRPRYNSLTVFSDSDTDWHILSSCNTSPILFPSSNSSVRILEEDTATTTTTTEDESEQQQQQQTYLPFHDGTGTFKSDQDGMSDAASPELQLFVPTAAAIALSDSTKPHDSRSSSSSSSSSVMSSFWKGLVRLGTHLIENDASTIETLSGIMSDAMVEGCLPFGSHLHMEFDNSTSSFFNKW